MDWNTYYNYPVAYKKWLIKRIDKEIEKAHKAQNDIPTKGAHHNSPGMRSMTGKAHPNAPAKLRRF